jgi:Fur family zinc uptake transcriptional regulator
MIDEAHPPVDENTRVQHTLAQAEQLCTQRGTRLTALRRRVLEIILSRDTPQGAYAILDVLRDDGRLGAPPTVYRALDFLLAQGLIHRLTSKNVFIGCLRPGEHHSGQFLICKDCGKVRELSSQALEVTIREKASDHDFQVDSQIVEVLGHCHDCDRDGSKVN